MVGSVLVDDRPGRTQSGRPVARLLREAGVRRDDDQIVEAPGVDRAVGCEVGRHADDRLEAWRARVIVHESEEAYLRCGDAPLPVKIDISNASRLALVVDFGERADEGDHADWLNARLVP